MNKELIRRHNSVVQPGDRVYHLGDFAWGNQHRQFVKALNGQHYLIRGNHEGKVSDDAGFIWVKDVFQLKIEGTLIWLSHYAHRVWPQSHYGAYALHGHSHGKLPGLGRSLDVGVDCWDYYPVSLDEVKSQLEQIPVPSLNKERT
jgi:calcineurin-like phosphoesterase family protein